VTAEALAARAREALAAAARSVAEGNLEQRTRELLGALEIYRQLGDRRGEADALLKLGNNARNVADHLSALDHFQAAEGIIATLGDRELERELVGQMGAVLMDLGDHRAALELAERELRQALLDDDPQRRLIALNTTGCVLGMMGRHEEGVARILESVPYIDTIESEARRAHLHVQTLADLAEAHLSWGRPAQAFDYAERGAEGARRIEHQPLLMLNLMYAGQAALRLDRLAEAERLLRATAELAGRQKVRSQESQALIDLGNTLARLGRHAEAFESYRAGHRIERDIRLDRAARQLEFGRAQKEIERTRREKESAERVLFSVLPRAIAARMTRGESRIAEEIADVSVLFADLVGFTAFSTRKSPGELLVLLEDVFSAFDALTTRHRLEKVKTIGDAYMAVGGALEQGGDHLADAARLGLALIDEVRRIGVQAGMSLPIRIGLHAGPVVAGVIGSERLSYDLWGESVNLASRLESSGVAGRIHVSSAVAQRLAGRFTLERRGAVELKGLGAVETFFLSAGTP
jgi:class 3 adenylate cyclase